MGWQVIGGRGTAASRCPVEPEARLSLDRVTPNFCGNLQRLDRSVPGLAVAGVLVCRLQGHSNKRPAAWRPSCNSTLTRGVCRQRSDCLALDRVKVRSHPEWIVAFRCAVNRWRAR